METITLGRNGDQSFSITGASVSGKHASVTINDNGKWVLRDLGSTNGTFVRDDDTGNLIAVGQDGVIINEGSFIVLAADNSTGCCFYGRQLLNPSDYFEEHRYMKQKKAEFDRMEEAVSLKAMLIRKGIFYSMLIFTLVTFIPGVEEWCNNTLGANLFMLYRGLSLLTMGASTFYDAQGKKARIKKLRKKFNQCPNPECDHRLSADNIDNMKCPRCQK